MLDEECLAIRLYTGPLYLKYNTTLYALLPALDPWDFLPSTLTCLGALRTQRSWGREPPLWVWAAVGHRAASRQLILTLTVSLERGLESAYE